PVGARLSSRRADLDLPSGGGGRPPKQTLPYPPKTASVPSGRGSPFEGTKGSARGDYVLCSRGPRRRSKGPSFGPRGPPPSIAGTSSAARGDRCFVRGDPCSRSRGTPFRSTVPSARLQNSRTSLLPTSLPPRNPEGALPLTAHQSQRPTGREDGRGRRCVDGHADGSAVGEAQGGCSHHAQPAEQRGAPDQP